MNFAGMLLVECIQHIMLLATFEMLKYVMTKLW